MTRHTQVAWDLKLFSFLKWKQLSSQASGKEDSYSKTLLKAFSYSNGSTDYFFVFCFLKGDVHFFLNTEGKPVEISYRGQGHSAHKYACSHALACSSVS